MESANKRRKLNPVEGDKPPWWRDLILFSHLIPCCQQYIPGYKEDFETEMKRRSSDFGDWSQFRDYLVNHPKNTGINYQVLREEYSEVGRSSSEKYHIDEMISWELVLCLMRNTISHEYTFTWNWLQELSAHAINYFGSRENIESMIKLYERSIISKKKLDPILVGSGDHPFYPSTKVFLPSGGNNDQISDGSDGGGSSRPLNTPLWDDLLLFLDLIPCRSLNSIVDETFEDEMSKLAKEVPFGDWTEFAMYLKTHPANPEQMQSNLDSIGYMVVIRLARNIVCHERTFNWCGVLELKNQFLKYFKTIDNIRLFIELFRKHCTGNLLSFSRDHFECRTLNFEDSSADEVDGHHRRLDRRNEDDHHLLLLLANLYLPNPIQIDLNDSVVVVPQNDEDHIIYSEVFLFVGMINTSYAIDRWISQLHSNEKKSKILMFCGPPRCGKSIISKFIAPFIIHQRLNNNHFKSVLYFDVRKTSLVEFYRSFLNKVGTNQLSSKNTTTTTSGISSNSSIDCDNGDDYDDEVVELEKKVFKMLDESIVREYVIIFDNFDVLHSSSSDKEKCKLLSLVTKISEDDLTVIFTSTLHPNNYLQSTNNNNCTTSDLSLVTSTKFFTIVNVTKIDSETGIFDAQRLLRFYYDSDKYKLKQIISDYEDSSSDANYRCDDERHDNNRAISVARLFQIALNRKR
eukprot:TRINITY_DN3073_c0_g1_i4.p1 TRINITY_DN3073_c0_g1~~TRINITY_DN3073_c0_g1_i4.p1  ORF type:complete len:687 (+),score=128.56 TRINITY_DN3073_c0_g1_i4:1643-3703(+)